MKQIHIALLLSSLFFAGGADAAEPAGYYSNCENRGGESLLDALHETISAHTTVSYGGLWELYKSSDVDDNGKIWDMYSTKRWNPGSEQCGNYSKIGDCYNREHSFPKSWFDDASPMVSDAFHIYPTDGKVNSQRSNYPYGECANGTSVAASGSVKPLGKLGKSTFPGYSGTVFEPDDQYKGDFARSYFYMAACYKSRIAQWNSEMLAGNDFPCFSSWAVGLLLKWHRMDPVSDKEIKRNEAVYARQENRNPFIDHPEMVEYIWGNKSSERWSSAAGTETEINSPLDGSVIDMGQMIAGHTASKVIPLRTTGAKGPVTVSSDEPEIFVVSPASVSAAEANKGSSFTVSFTPAAAGTNYGIITVRTGSTVSVVDFKGTCVDRLPVNGAREITDNSFTATWAYIGDDNDGNYTLDVRHADASVAGYPRAVPAHAGEYTVTGLEPATVYTYTVSSESLSSGSVSVTTGEPVPAIEFLYDGLLIFATEPGAPSEAEEILIDTDNIDGDFTVSVDRPFELSLDKTNWTTTITVTPDDSRLYLRFNSDEAGSFRTSLTALYRGMRFDNAVVTATAAVEADFLETFEPAGRPPYSTWTYDGSACVWNIANAGFGTYADPRDAAYGGEQALRVNNKGTGGLIEMAQDRLKGIGTVSFFAHRWGDDTMSYIDVEYSTDGGESWALAGSVVIDEFTYTQYSVAVNVAGTARMRLHQTDGKRFIIDNIAITPYTTGLSDPTAPFHRWDAFCRDGKLTVEVRDAGGLDVTVYAIDGTTVFSGRLPQGLSTIGTAPGFFIVAAGGDARTLPVH